MHRFNIGIFLTFIVMLTACASNANSPEDIETVQQEVFFIEKENDDNRAESDGEGDTANLDETAQADDKAEDTTDAAQPNGTSEKTAKTTQTDVSDDTDTVYLKPCSTYQDILDNTYEVIVADRNAEIIEADVIFSSVGISEAGIGRSTDESLACIGYTFYDVDGNGIEELIIADVSDGDGGPWDNRILLMYSLDDDKPVLLIDGWARSRYYLLNDDTIYYEGSGGAAYTTFATYHMAEDGISLKVIDYYFSDYLDGSIDEYWLAEGNWGWFHNTTGEHAMDESELVKLEDEDMLWAMMEDYMTQVKQLGLTFFETYKQ